jgi:anthranilate phosphoribosyltransferase
MDIFSDAGGWPGVLGRLASRQDLTTEVARAAMDEILAGAATPAQLAGFVVALRLKGETVEELSGLRDGLLAAAELVELPAAIAERAVDIVGTGGDRSHSINVSTLAALVVAGAGVPVCKHGNRAASSSSGSADVLEALGFAIELGPADVVRCVVDAGFGFCFAPRFHPAMRHAGPTRRELGIPTVFNSLGPMANPARVGRYVLGVADAGVAERVAKVLASGGARRALVVHGGDGLDELTTTTTSTAYELRDGTVHATEVDATAFGLARARPNDLRGGDPGENAAIARRVLAGEHGPHRDVVVLNAAAGLVVAGEAVDLAAGVVAAAGVIDDGRAAAALARAIEASQRGRQAT